MRHAVVGSAISRFNKSDRPRRGGDHLPRPRAKAQSELQHIEGRFGMTPLGELVAQAAENCGPRRLSGSSAEKPCAIAPLRKSRGRATAPTPDAHRAGGPRAARTPSIITSRVSRSVSPISAMRAAPIRPVTHPSGAGACLPRAAPAEMSHVVQGAPLCARTGARWCGGELMLGQNLASRSRSCRVLLHQEFGCFFGL